MPHLHRRGECEHRAQHRDLGQIPASILTRSFDYGGKLGTMYKDVSLCLEEARDLKVPMWLGSQVVQMWFQGMAEGRGDDDYTSLIKVIETWANVVVGGNESGTGDLMIVKLNHRIDGNGPHVLLLHAVGVDLTFLDAVATKTCA